MELSILILGFLFGAILQSAKLNKYNVIGGLATLDNLAVAKAIAVTIGIGAILLNAEIGFGLAQYHVKPLILGGIVLGGFIFGVGMAILGYCPGTLAVSLGEGSLDAFFGILGALVGGLIYTVLLPYFSTLLGPDFGAISLFSLTGSKPILFYLLVFVLGAVFIGAAFWLHKIERSKDMKWLYAGASLAVLNGIVFLSAVANRPIGASTTYPYLADFLTNTTNGDYFQKIQKPGSWELFFLAGAFLSGILLSLLRKDFKLTLIHDHWKKHKGTNAVKRIIWSFVGGFILIFGARMAGGCTSGHIVSGGMQLAASSLLFAVFVFAGLLLTGKLFYKQK
ncbi:MAG: YeeE/YedE family protein [Bacteroidales bacterium]|nr:YeeE/YedE family protein [Bacteroidales bacterium]